MKFGVSYPFPCNYLSEEQEQLLIYHDENGQPTVQQYENLLDIGFRRSGGQIYRPHCRACSACESLRIPVNDFVPSRSQKRIMAKNKDIQIKIHDSYQPEFYVIYQDYINAKHRNGGMYPPSEQQLKFFAEADWHTAKYIGLYKEDKLIGVAITDLLTESLSALYTFYAPEYETLSIGTHAILQQISLAQTLGKQYVYLGYFISNCDKMKYKQKFYPHERFVNQHWHLFAKNSA